VLRDARLDIGSRTLPPALAKQLENLRKSFEQVAMPLPDAPVGAGAIWIRTTPSEQGGLALVATTTITLAGVTNDRAEITTRTIVAGRDQAITEQGTTIEVKHIAGTGTSTATVDLARMVMTGEITAELASDMSAEGQTSRMTMKTRTKLTAKPEM
jgi:hypothetical protein